MELTLWLGKQQPHLSQERDFWSVLWFGHDSCFVVLRPDSSVVLFLLWFIVVTEWSWLVLGFCEIVYVWEECAPGPGWERQSSSGLSGAAFCFLQLLSQKDSPPPPQQTQRY